MWKGQDFGHRNSGYQRYPTGFTGFAATRIACVSGVSPSSYQRYSANISTEREGDSLAASTNGVVCVTGSETTKQRRPRPSLPAEGHRPGHRPGPHAGIPTVPVPVSVSVSVSDLTQP